jgi:hypothetical protein
MGAQRNLGTNAKVSYLNYGYVRVCEKLFKETVTRDFRHQVSFKNQFPQAPQYPIGPFQIF